METLLIELTPEQEEKLFPLFADLEDCGAVFAQCYIDGVSLQTFSQSPAISADSLLQLSA